MQSNRKFVIILSLIVIIIIALSVFYFVKKENSPLLTIISNNNEVVSNELTTNNVIISNKENENKSNNNLTNNTNNRRSLGKLNDYQEFFNVNALINAYYFEMTSNNKTALLNIMDPSYIVTKNITENNISNFIVTGYEDITFVSKVIYAKGQNNIMYYFVNGEEQLYNFADEELFEKENINYLVTIDINNGAYSITPLTGSSLFDYAQSYKMLSSKKIELNNYNEYKASTYSDQTISVYYLNYFRIMLYLNTEKAYNMLSSEYKNSFNDYEDFVNHLESIYELLNSNILSYAVKGENGSRYYSIISNNEQRIDFNETAIMNFAVTIK